MTDDNRSSQSDEEKRLTRLHGLNVLDSGPEPVFDNLVKMASLVCDMPISLVSLVDRDRQWFKANHGLEGATETPRDIAFCAHAIASDDLFEIPDATLDPRFANNPLVNEAPNIRFYAGAPLLTSDGCRLGTLCVIDRQPRLLNDMQREVLRTLAIAAVKVLEGNRATSALIESEGMFRALSDASPLGIFRTAADGSCTYTNSAWHQIYGLSFAESLGHQWGATIHPDDKAAVISAWQAATSGSAGFEMSFRIRHPEAGTRYVHVRSRPVIDPDQRVLGYVGAVDDISDRKSAEKNLLLSRNRLQSILDGTNVGTWEWNVQTGNGRVNERWAQMVGYTLAELEPVTIRTLIKLGHPVDLAQSAVMLQRHFKGELNYYEFDMRLRHRQGHWVWVQGRGCVATRDEHGKPLWVMGTHSDITARIETERQLQERKFALEMTGQLANVGGWTADLRSGDLRLSDETCRILAIPSGSSMTLAEALLRYAPASHGKITAAVEAASAGEAPLELEVEMRTGDGRRIWAALTMRVEFAAQRPIGLVGALKDITRRYDAERALAESRELLQVTLESIGDAVITTDVDGVVTWMNPVAEKMTGWSNAEGCGQAIQQVFNIVHDDTRAPMDNPVLNCLAEGAAVTLTDRVSLISRDGTEYGIQDSAAPIRDRERSLLGAVLVFHDVTEQRQLGKTMQYRATHDPMTGLINRGEFEHRLSRVFRHAQESGSSNALMYIDLDQFKIVNDSCGHAIGDQLLKQVAMLLGDCVRRRDTLARLGGDEFGVLLEHCTVEQAERVGQKICDEMNTFRFENDGRRYRVGTSIGLVSIAGDSVSEVAILQAADAACYAAKEAGRNRVHIWQGSDQITAARTGEMRWAPRIEQALDEDRFALYAQRIVPLDVEANGIDCEILLRMRTADNSLIPPGAFLPAAERYHLASRVDRWVIRQVFALLEDRRGQMDKINTIAVNLSGQSIGDREFHRFMREMIEAARFDTSKLCLEITETAVIHNIADARKFVGDVRNRGVRVALDDFGAGASSFGYLKSLPVDYLKIDGQFVKDILTDPLALAAVRCFVEVASVVGIATIAEFVETEEVLAKLREIGVNHAQGYLFHKPEPVASVLPATGETRGLEGLRSYRWSSTAA